MTNARGGFSNHNFGLAVDLCPFENNQPQWNDDAGFNAIGVAAKHVGLEWGGSWKKLVDKPHVQLPGLSVAQCRILFERGGLQAVWASLSGVSSSETAATPFNPVLTPTIAVKRDLAMGDSGDDVKALQTKLGLTADGQYGLKTKAAVVAFQTRNHLQPDGIVGPHVRAKLGL